MMTSIGRIFGEVIDSNFTFASMTYYKQVFVKIPDWDGGDILVGKIISRKTVNKILSTPQVVRYLSNDMNLNRDTLYVYEASLIGVIRDKGALYTEKDMSVGNASVLPGGEVYAAGDEEIASVYGIAKTKYQVGYLKEAPGCKVYLDLEKIFSPHMTIIGKTGSGKSYFTKGLLRQMAKQKFYIFSPSDEYNAIAQETSADLQEDIILPLDVDHISYFLNLNMSEEAIYQKINFASGREYTVKEILGEIITYYQKLHKNQNGQMRLDFGEVNEREVQIPQYALTLMQKFRNLKNIKFMNRPSEKVGMKKSTVFDMSEYTQVEQECIINYYLYRIYQKCRKNKNASVEKQFIFIEEAHNYVPSVKNTLCKDILIRLAREGRKYGICLCFITQRPRNFDQTSFSQSSNKVIFSVPHPDDVKYVLDDAVYYNTQMAAQIPRQGQGECIFVGDAFKSEIAMCISFENLED